MVGKLFGNSLRFGYVLAIGFGILCPRNVVATQATLRIGFSRAPGTMNIVVRDTDNVPLMAVPVDIPGEMNPIQAGSLVAAQLAPLTTVVNNDESFVFLPALPDNAGPIELSIGATGQDSAGLGAPGARSAWITFSGTFAAYLPGGNPTTFRAGVLTDRGAVVADVSSVDLNFQLDAHSIHAALFQRLAPQASDNGFQIAFANDRLEICFDPAYSVVQGSIVYGTTAHSPEVTGVLNPLLEDPTIPGDANGDGVVDIFDVNAVSDAWGTAGGRADLNRDGTVDIFDVNLISDNWTLSSSTAVPEPRALGMALVLLVGWGFHWTAKPRPAGPNNPN